MIWLEARGTTEKIPEAVAVLVRILGSFTDRSPEDLKFRTNVAERQGVAEAAKYLRAESPMYV